MFEHIDPYPGDPIFALVEAFQRDARPEKVNLSIGLYYDEEGRIPLLDVIRRAAARPETIAVPRTYLPIEGSAPYREAVQKLLFGAASPALAERRVATIQSLGGSASLKIGADFVKRYFPASEVWISDPSWENHRSIFEGAGFEVREFPYYDARSNAIAFDAMLATLERLPARAVVLLQPCCHNPTGLDLDAAQWPQLVELLRRRALIPFLDLAYQGFGAGLDEDAAAVRALADAGLSFLVTSSFSKNMALYGERCGALSIVCANAQEADAVLGQLKAAVRRVYSSPPMHAARLVEATLLDAAARAEWEGEVARMRERIRRMRALLRERLAARLSGMDFDYLVRQRGMFSYTGLTAAEVDALREEHAVYLVRSGRMCVAGLREANVDRVAAGMAAVLARRTEPARAGAA